MIRENHWECQIFDTVHPAYFSPPNPPIGNPIGVDKPITAYHNRKPIYFKRFGIGQPWIRGRNLIKI